MIIYNKYIPFKGYKAINLFGFIFVRNGCTMSDIDINHENIHTAQMKELLYVLFYLWYFIEFIFNIIKYQNVHTAYKNISFEKEAYCNEKDLDYLKRRRPHEFITY